MTPVFASWLALVAGALAQEPAPQMNTQLFRPAIGSTSTLWTETSAAAPDGYASGRAFLQYANRPFRLRVGDDTEVVVQDVAELDLAGAFHYKGLRLGAHVPVYAWTASPVTDDQAGLGDILLDLQGRVIDGEQAPVGVALAGRLILPTGSVAAPLGARSTGWELAGIVDKQIGDVVVATNVGTRGVPRATYEHVVWDDQLFLRAGAGWNMVERAGLSAELGAQTNWSSGENPAGTAAELMGGGWFDVTDSVVLRGGVSAGLGRAPGTPAARVLAGVSWEPDTHPDQDLDGVVDRDDWCELQAEDVDGFDDWDGCPDPQTTVVVQLTDPDGAPVPHVEVVFDGPETHELGSGDGQVLTLHPGTYTATATAPGFEPWREELVIGDEAGRVIERPMVARMGSLRVWAVDDAGGPVDASFTVSGSEPWPADGQRVDVPAGEHALVISAPGYTAQAVSLHVDHGQGREYSAVLTDDAPSDVRLTSDRIEIDEQVYFDLNKATIKASSHGLLDEVAAAILANPEISRVRIEGHTDDQGPSRFNEKLSQQRADAVRAYLERRGVDPSRLRSVGYGSSRPLRNGDSDAAHEANRRVEFHLES